MTADEQRAREVDIDALMGQALRAQGHHVRESHAINRRGWTQDQWVEDAQRLMNDPDGSVLALLNGHATALIAAARERDQLRATVTELRGEVAQLRGEGFESDVWREIVSTRQAAIAERNALRATVDRARALHTGEPLKDSAVGPAWCSECGGGSPCATLLALDGEVTDDQPR